MLKRIQIYYNAEQCHPEFKELGYIMFLAKCFNKFYISRFKKKDNKHTNIKTNIQTTTTTKTNMLYEQICNDI